MAKFTYKIAFRDDIDNQYITSSTIAPYFPPSAANLNTIIENNIFSFTEDDANFVGFNSQPSRLQAYQLPDGQTVVVKETYNQDYFIEVTIPTGLQNPANPQQNGPYIFQSNETTSEPSPSYIIDFINTRESRVNYGSTWTRFKVEDLKPINPPQNAKTYGFRILTPGYQELQFFSEVGIQSQNGVIDLGVKVLSRIQVDQQKEITSFQEVDSNSINNNSPSGEKAKGLDRLSQILQKRSSTLKTVLVTALTAEIAQFGISNVKELIEQSLPGQQQPSLDQLLEKLPKLCPTRAKIEQIITIRNRYTDQINTFFTNVQRLSTGLTGSQQVAQAISIGVTVTSTVRKAANIALAFVPLTPGAAPSSINILKDLEEEIKPRLDKIIKTVGVLTSTIAFVAAILNIIIQLLKILDTLILLCSQQLGIPFDEINNLLNSLDNQLISNLQNTTPNINNTYKGFRFEIILDTTNNTKYPKRFVVAKDKFGVILLKSDSSFAPNPQVLINELKFIIDRDRLSAE
jgi:hypothetical protein